MNKWTAFLLFAVVVALALRLPQLDNRPMHNDEAVNAIKFGALWERGDYRYDPHEYHGPTLHYLTAALNRLSAAPDFAHFSEVRLRLLTALAGAGLVLLLPLVRDGLGRGATAAAALFTAISPVMVFYSRYWIHEMLLVLFTFLALGAAWRFRQKPSWIWALVAGAALGLMQATKETFVLAVAAAVGAGIINWAWNRFALPSSIPWRAAARWAGWGLGAWLAVWLLFFTSFFTNPEGPLDSIRTYIPWVSNAGASSVHAHEGGFYLERLFWFHPKGGPVWSEALLLALAAIGGAEAFRRQRLTDGDGDLIRFLTGYTVLLALIYSVIPYKTPWCALGFAHGIILLAGVGTAVLWRLCARLNQRVLLVAVVGLGCGHLGWQAWRASFPLCADRSNPWVYAQTSSNLRELVLKVRAVAAAGEGDKTVIKTIAEDGDYWPLPWDLRMFPNTGWWSEVPQDPKAPMVIASASLGLALDQDKTHIMVGYFQLRPGVFLELYVERGLWERYLAGQPKNED